MRALILAATAVGALAAGAAIAQTPPPGGPDGGPPPPPPRDGRGGPGGYEHGFMHDRHMPPPPKAAFFRFRKGDASVTVKCADDEPTKACTDAVAAMMGAINAPAPAR